MRCSDQLVKGANAAQCSDLLFDNNPAQFLYLNQSGCIDIPDVSDADEFNVLTEAMDSLQFSPVGTGGTLSAQLCLIFSCMPDSVCV